MRKVALFALIGVVVGLLVAQFFPSLGRSGLDKGFSDLAFELGAKRPYLFNAGIGAAVGVLVGWILGEKN